MKPKEKVLFVTLWGLILLSVGLWKFRIQAPSRHSPSIEIILNQELNSFFSSATLLSEVPDSYQVSLKVHPTYLASLSGDSIRLHLKYDLTVNHKVAYENSLAVVVAPHKTQLTFQLPNPLRLAAQTISLSLAR